MGVEKQQEMKPRNRQDEGNGAKIGPESTWLTHANLSLGAGRQTSISIGPVLPHSKNTEIRILENVPRFKCVGKTVTN
jgi:hypothetical protein